MKTTLIVVISMVVLAGGVFFFLNSGSDDEPAISNDASTVAEDAPETTGTETEPVAAVTNQNYLDYSDEAFAAAADTNRVLFFHANWCPYCRTFDNYISGQNIPDDITLLKIDYDSSPDLKQKYGVYVQATLVAVDSNGDVLDSWHTTETPTLDDFTGRIY